MNGTRVAVAVAVLLSLIGLGAATYLGGGALGPGEEEVLTNTPESTGTVYEVDGSSGGETGTATATDDPPFAFLITTIEECGRTCRDVTVEFTNQQEYAATDVVVYTRVYAGNSTDETDEVWAGQETIGTMDAGETITSTRRIELTFQEGMAVRNSNGWITIMTTVETSETTVTFVRREQVA
jgi:hypothetical protein